MSSYQRNTIRTTIRAMKSRKKSLYPWQKPTAHSLKRSEKKILVTTEEIKVWTKPISVKTFFWNPIHKNFHVISIWQQNYFAGDNLSYEFTVEPLGIETEAKDPVSISRSLAKVFVLSVGLFFLVGVFKNAATFAIDDLRVSQSIELCSFQTCRSSFLSRNGLIIKMWEIKRSESPKKRDRQSLITIDNTRRWRSYMKKPLDDTWISISFSYFHTIHCA